MKRTIGILLLSIFLCGCNISIGNKAISQIWDKTEIGYVYTFKLKSNYTNTIKYYRIEQITEKEYRE